MPKNGDEEVRISLYWSNALISSQFKGLIFEAKSISWEIEARW